MPSSKRNSLSIRASTSLPILTDVNIVQRPLDSTLFPGFSSSILAHAGFAQAQEKYVK